jgi:gamma-glutamyltranspeptidase/glutathione hydrolase
MAVAMTQSLGPTGGSRVATPGLGFLYAATLGYLDRAEPGDRPWSSQSPLVALRDGRLAFVLGGGGSRRIISAMVQTLVRVELDGVPLQEAMSEGRFHPTDRWHFEQIDPTQNPAGADLARTRGFDVLIRPLDSYFARLNGVAVDPSTGLMTGVVDPRWVWGVAVGPEAIER